MIRLFLLASLVLTASSCKTQTQKSKDKIQYVRSYDYRIVIDVSAAFWGFEAKYVLDNRRIGLYDSIDMQNGWLKPLTLYYISYSKKTDTDNQNIEVLVPVDTIEIAFSKENSNKLFDLTKNFFKKMNFNNTDTLINGIRTEMIVEDDAKAVIELDFRGRQLKGTISSISNPSISTREFDRLFNFIKNFKPSDRK
jgi:hypothetical protein